MPPDSRIAGLYRKSVGERIDALVNAGFLDNAAAQRLKSGQPLLPVERADKMVENVIGTFGLPFAVAANFVVDGRDRLVPMAVEEPSIVAGLSHAARIARRSGGFITEYGEALLAGQVHLAGVSNPAAAIDDIMAVRQKLLASANDVLQRLVRRGGGARDLECRLLQLAGGEQVVCVQIYVDTRDAMGANLVNTVCEHIAAELETLSGGRSVLRILSNLADRAVVSSRVTLPLESLAAPGFEAEAVRDGIVSATAIAAVDAYRAATHNKGIMNGIDAVAIATGNDWRAIDAGAHAWAARGGSYSSLTDWQVGANGALEGRITLPLKVGTVGGSLQANPGAELGLAIAGVSGAGELAALMAAVGLAQNFAALRALVTHGIQRGHMRLHARSVASTAAVPAAIFDRVVAAMIESGDINVSTARELTARLSASRAPVKDAASSESRSGYGVAAGKVILLGEHAAVYDKHVLALPLLDAVSARVEEKGHELEVHLVELGRDRGADLGADSGGGIAAAIELMLDSLDVRSRGFRIVVESRVPAAMGLGSSAAFAVAIIRAFDDFYELRLDDDRVNALAFDCEKLAHGTPSGIDNTLATFARPVLYRRSASPTTRALSLDEQPPVVVAASGTRGMTRDQVSGVRQRYERQPRLFSRIFDEIDALSLRGADALRDGDYVTLGEYMNVCQGFLNAIGVSTPELEAMISVARRAGATGAKLTGAGGGGSIVALCPGCEADVAAALRAAGYDIVVADPVHSP